MPIITNDIILQNHQIRLCRSNYQNLQTDNDFDESVLAEHYLGSMNILCTHCTAKHFASEKVINKGSSFNDCCSHGEVKLDPLPDPPSILKELFSGIHPLSNHFYDHIRPYNSSFSFASFNANLVTFRSRRPGPFCFKIQGQIYYQINTSLYPANNEAPSNGQLFIVDSNEAVDYRLNTHRELNRNILRAIDTAMRQHNVFAQSYQMMKDELDLMTTANHGIEPELQLLFTLKKGHDQRRYNFQRVNEVAAVFSTTADGDIPESYVTIRNKHTKELQYVSTMDENVEAWTYPLFYPHGTKGWHDGIRMENSVRRVTRNAYIKYQMAIRDDCNTPILMGRRLFQQWVVDHYVKMERDRMTFLRNNRKQMRADSYKGLLEHLQNRANNTNSQIGKVVILPSSYQGSPRNMLQTYQDAMAIKEITENLLDGQTASDRPDLVARVFEVQAYVFVIEYQKRGLPHVHLLLTLQRNSKITTPAIVDKFISAEIPNPNKNPRLYEIVKKNMIHGPCGDWCLNEKGKCSKHYPKEFTDVTTLNENGYPQYRRRDTGTYTRQDGFTFSNKHVVPYNKELPLLLNCHINVEVVSSIKAVKYLYKYIYKGHDAAAIVVQETDTNGDQVRQEIHHDEIREFIETRYVSPPEACARILNYSLHGRSHAVVRLPIHLPNQQTVMVDDIDNEDAIQTALSKESMLIAYFALNAHDPQARHLTYSEIPTERGATSYENLRTVDGVVHETYVSTCLALGLIEDDNEWKNAMHEAEVWMMPRQLRQLFIRILLHCHPIHPEELWEDFKDALSQDYSRTMPLHQAHRTAYIKINTLLQNERSSLMNFPSMPQITEIENDDSEISLEQHKDIGSRQYEILNEEQKAVVDTISNRVVDENSSESKCFFIDGPGGSGKTYIYITLYHLLQSQCKNVTTMAYTGIAATLLPRGKTVHKTFKLPIALYSDSSLTIKAQSKEADHCRKMDVIMWDEAPMSPKHALEFVDRTLRDIMNKNELFGGKILILGGDFRQLLPFALTKNMRTRPGEVEFTKYLLKVGDGTANNNDSDFNLPDHCIAPREADIPEDVYGINSIKNCDNGDISNTLLPEFLETLNPPNLPPHELRLRKHTVVMLIRNLSVNEGLCNGTRLQVLDCSNHLLRCKISTGDKRGEIVFINRITLYSDDAYPFEFGRRQFPIKLAFAMTINKSQGQTFEKIGIDLKRDIFNHGQLLLESCKQ
ncbi:uncharacterized protein LOC122850453 [Aphidius gifuensis]|uniref:uncharacterized protein LOC122850453 n=1 Tax=Aphidius gifuensis TaxID=684658 RepID=UPI001CDC384D|nr:uncharacterized protein LOC122850453 [Aphidius gifuensis]